MNPRDREQLGVFRRYLLEQAGQSRSRLFRNQVRRWVGAILAALVAGWLDRDTPVS